MILPKIKVLRSHGKQYIPDLDAVELTEEFRGRPHLTETPDTADLERAAAICPTGALTTAPLSLDLGRCLFCGECARTAPRNIRFTNDYRIGSPTREGLVVRPGDKCVRFDPAAVRPEIGRYFGRSLQLREVCAGGDASVEMELNATGNVNFDLGRYGIGFTASPRHADGVVVSGPITVNMAEALRICCDAVANPKILVVCGSEACSGGLFAGSRAVDRTFFDTHAADLWLPGAPTHPMTFIDGILNLLGKKNANDHATTPNDFRLVLQDRAFHLRRRIRHAAAHRAGADRQARMDRAQGILGPADPRAVGSRTDRHQYLGIRRLQDAGSQRCRRGTAGQRPAVVRHHPRNRPDVRRHPSQSGRGRGLQGHAPGCRCADRGAGFFARARHALVDVLRHRGGGLRRMVSGLVADLHPDRRGRDRHFMDAAHH